MRTDHLGVAVVGLGLAIVAVVGCGTATHEDRPSQGEPSSFDPLAATASALDQSKLFADWPKPDGAILISGEQIGFLEPCGCSAGQRGGLARRLDLIQKLEGQGWDLVKIDLGSLINDPNTLGGPLETRIRYTHALRALEVMGYDAFALSPVDLKLGVDEALTQYMNYLGERPKAVSANVRPIPGFDENVPPVVRAQAGPVSVGITAVIDPGAYDELRDPAKDDVLSFTDPNLVLPEILADLERDTHMQVLMVQGPPEAAERLARRFPGFDLVVSTSPFVDPPRDAQVIEHADGQTHLVSVGKKGQWVGVVGLYQNPDEKFRYQRVELNQRYDVELEPIYSLLNDDFQAELKAADVLSNYPRRSFVSAGTPTEARFVGAENCRACHQATYDHWSETGHAHAYESLVSGPRGNHQFDAHCINCHTVGFEYTGGFVNAELTPQFKNVQCENCHGPGSLHAASPTDPQLLKTVAVELEEFRRNNRCVACHSEDDSPNFDFDKYWVGINHNGLDEYSEPARGTAIRSGGVDRKVQANPSH